MQALELCIVFKILKDLPAFLGLVDFSRSPSIVDFVKLASLIKNNEKY
jgi:hypothetical protein